MAAGSIPTTKCIPGFDEESCDRLYNSLWNPKDDENNQETANKINAARDQAEENWKRTDESNRRLQQHSRKTRELFYGRK